MCYELKESQKKNKRIFQLIILLINPKETREEEKRNTKQIRQIKNKL